MKLHSLLASICALATLAAAGAGQKDDSFTVAGNVTLTESKTVGYLDIKAGAWPRFSTPKTTLKS